MKNKKAMEMSIGVVVVAVILLVTAAVVIYSTTSIFRKEASHIEGQIGELDDKDGDNVINMFDKCPCDSGDQKYDGCQSENDKPKNPDEVKSKKSCLTP